MRRIMRSQREPPTWLGLECMCLYACFFTTSTTYALCISTTKNVLGYAPIRIPDINERDDVSARVAFSACVRLGEGTSPCCCCWWALSVRPRVPPLSCRPEGAKTYTCGKHYSAAMLLVPLSAWGGGYPSPFVSCCGLARLAPRYPPIPTAAIGGVPPQRRTAVHVAS